MRGHEVVGVCADGPLLAAVRAEGFRVETVPMARSYSPLAQWRAWRALVTLLRRERPDLVHGHMPISGFLARLAARAAGVPKVAYTCHGFLFNQPGPAWRRGLALAMEWLGGRLTDVHMTVSEEEAADARRLRIHPRSVGIGNGRDPRASTPTRQARARIRAELGVPEERVVVVDRFPPGAPQGPSGTAGRHAQASMPSCGWWASGWPPTTARTWSRISPPAASARGCAGLATARTCRRCWRAPTSSRCPAISRGCRCR